MRHRFSEEECRAMFPWAKFPKPITVKEPPKGFKKSTWNKILAKANIKAQPAKSRRNLEKECLQLRSKLVRQRDNHTCQWCGSKNGPQDHHILARSICNKLGCFDLRNGVTLCYRCHIFRLKSDPDAYIAWRDQWLAKRGLSYQQLRELFGTRCKIRVDELVLIRDDMKKKLGY